MRLVTFTQADRTRIGVLTPEGVVDPGSSTRDGAALPTTMTGLLDLGDDGLRRMAAVAAAPDDHGATVYPESEVALTAPVPNPPLLIMMGINGRLIPTLKDKGWKVPDEYSHEPWWFLVPPAAVIGPNDPSIRPVECADFGNSPELGVVIGRPTWRVSPEQALHHVVGYTAVNDVTLWDIQKRDHFMYTTTAVKSFPTSKPMGHCITTLDEIADPNDVSAECWINGKLIAKESTAGYRFPVAEVVSHVSRFVYLRPGTVIAMGALPGILEMTVEPGDVVVNDFVGVATLTNPFRDERDITPDEYLAHLRRLAPVC